MKIFDLLYQLKSDNILLWYKNGGTIEFSYNKSMEVSAELREQIKLNKVSLLDILKFNKIDSEDAAKKVIFYCYQVYF